MDLAHRWIDRNLTRLELAAAFAILAVLFGYSMRYMLVMFSRAERSMVETTIVNMNSALRYHIATAALRGEYDLLSGTDTLNPFSLLESAQQANIRSEELLGLPVELQSVILVNAPVNYMGELNAAAPDVLEAGNWYFDTSDDTLVYLVRNSELFHSDLEGVPRIRYRVFVDYDDVDGNGTYDPGVDHCHDFSIRGIDNFVWAE